MLDKIIKVIKMEDGMADAVVITYDTDIHTDGLPHLPCIINRKIYCKESTDVNIPYPYEEILSRLFYAADKRTGPKEALFELATIADNEIYDATKRWISNTIICNSKTKKYAEALVKQGINKNIIVSDEINDGWLLLMLVPDDQLSYAAVAVKNEIDNIIKLDIINPCLLKSIKIEGDLE